jgi:hypothetical protein
MVCEARSDHETASILVDTVLLHHIEWMEEGSLDSHRRWRGSSVADTFLIWKNVREEAEKKRFKPHGHFNGQPEKPDAHVARLTLFVLTDASQVPKAVLLIRDSDNDLSRREGLPQAIDDKPWPFPVLIGLAHTKRECWVLNGFAPKNKDEEERLSELKKQLLFDPCTKAERLAELQNGAPRDAKRVLRVLSNGERERENDCLREPLEDLKRCGAHTGLTAFIEAVERELVPLWQ